MRRRILQQFALRRVTGSPALAPLLAAPALALLLAAPAVARTDSPDPPARRPQEPLRPLPYIEHSVAFSTPAGRLAGTLALPPGTGPHPAVVLVAGSGPQDRDASIAGHRPFLVLADHLVRSGIAVLRYDERGVGGSQGRHGDATPLDFADDAAAALAWLARRPEIDGGRTGYIGHSEGGMVAPLALERTGQGAFLVLLAAPGIPLRHLAPRQAQAMARAEGLPARQVEAQRRLADGIATLLAAGLEAGELKAAARPILLEGFAGLPPVVREREVERALAHYASPWATFAMRHDPREPLRAVRVPVLALNGARDTQVDARSNLEGIANALRGGGNRQVEVRTLPGLNHYFQTARTGAFSEYARIDETFAPAALSAISGWILETLRQR
jgi:uncharacterized protein